ncbi:MAG: hypothetical protein K9K76_04980 [Halanaerobiales bacterium]|nr:hypothetical protein [Halanaerobiales bacterium]
MKKNMERIKSKEIYYAGIGSRQTPQDILKIMEHLALCLGKNNYILRSGGSPGADTAFETGAKKAEANYEIFLPWNKFRDRMGKNYIDVSTLDTFDKAKKIAKQNHPYFNELSPDSKKLIIRDTYQVLGKDLNTPSEFVVCWTPDGCITDRDRSKETGGTGQAISIASKRGIPIFNLKLREHKRQIKEWLGKLS